MAETLKIGFGQDGKLDMEDLKMKVFDEKHKGILKTGSFFNCIKCNRCEN